MFNFICLFGAKIWFSPFLSVLHENACNACCYCCRCDADTRFDCCWINGVSIMWTILSWMKRLMISRQHDLMIYHRLTRSRQIQIKYHHSTIHQTLCLPTAFVTLTAAIIIQIRIKCTHLRLLPIQRHRSQYQRPLICQPTLTRLITIQALIDIGPDFRTQLTKGEKWFFFCRSLHPKYARRALHFDLHHSFVLGLLQLFPFASRFSFGLCVIHLPTDLCTSQPF